MRVVTYYYAAHSAFAYLGAARLTAICAAQGARLWHRPVDLGAVMAAAGGRPFRARTQGHVDYFFGREIERWAQWRDVPVIAHRPTHHDAPVTLANGLLISAQEAGADVDTLSFAVLQAHWRDDADLSDRATLRALLTGLAMPETLLEAAESAPVRAHLDANTAAAVAAGAPGSPTYVLEDEMFYGQDRLEMLERAMVTPFAPSRWRNPPVG